jgi:NAD(P)-dependent dehydrogenase (short-subunit alcohol dehydrogenase family)
MPTAQCPASATRHGDRLAGTVALVTGIGSGIGRACALLFVRQGAKVVGCDITAEAAQACVNQARTEGLEMHSVHPCDLTQPSQVERFVAKAMELHSAVDVVVNAAAWCAMAPIEQMDYEQHWRRTLTFELDLVFLLCKAAWPYLRARGGAIVNFASANAHQALENSPALAHCAGKGGVLAMTRQLALEGAPHGIRANTISPGLVETGSTEPVLRGVPGFREMVTAKHMLGRLGTPEDIAWRALFVASDEASWITAADFAVDGGVTKW